MPIVDILILGAGWTSGFLIPLCRQRNISFAATTRSGSASAIASDSTGINYIKFAFDQTSSDYSSFEVLPDARTVLITFPITVEGGSRRLVEGYLSTRKDTASEQVKSAFIQLGATSIWGELKLSRKNRDPSVPEAPAPNKWYDRHSPYNHADRSDAEDELLQLAANPEFQTPTTVLDLAGLYGGTRSMKKWVGRVAPTKEVLRNKGSLHMIHGIDVARAILAVHGQFSKASGQRWLLTDGRVYDWWDLASGWSQCSGPTDAASTSNSHSHPSENQGPQASWVLSLMRESGVRALPRSNETLGRALDSREFWETFELVPLKGRMEE